MIDPLTLTERVVNRSAEAAHELKLYQDMSRKVLIVEDDPDIRDTLQQVLQFEGFDVAVASNGLEGLQVLRDPEKPCLILLDLMMPVMNGWEFIAEKKADEVIANIPVVIISAVAERTETPQVEAYVKKPIDIELLMNVVKSYCKN